MKKSAYGILIFIVFFVMTLMGSGNTETGPLKKNLEFIKSYRYSPVNEQKVKNFHEVSALAKAMIRIYFDFASMGCQHFSKHPVDFLWERMPDFKLIRSVLVFTDRLARHIAYISLLYEIDIKTGLAIDPFDGLLKK